VRKWKKKNPERNKELWIKANKKRRLSPTYKLSCALSGSIWRALKSGKCKKHWETLVNYTLQDLITHLESKFKDGMSWENYGKWHIDHKKPISSFNFSSYEDPEFEECWALTNLQPLWASENISKGVKL